MPTIVPLTLILGFLTGILVNLIADYLPAQRHHELARANPFVSPSAVPPRPTFLPRHPDGRLWPIWMWSGLVAWLTGSSTFVDRHATRHVLTEIGLAVGFAWIAWTFAGDPDLAFLLFYGAVFILIIIIDVEHRWVMLEIIVPAALVAILESTSWPRISLGQSLKGGLYGFLITFALYLLGIVFGRVMGVVTHRRITRTVYGLGDVYIGTLGGLIVGVDGLWWAILIMVLTGGVASLGFILYKVIRTRRYRVFSAIPYGPYIVIGFAALLYIPEVIDLIFRRLLGWPY